MPFSSNENQLPNRFPAVPVLPKMTSLPTNQFDPYRSPVAANEISDELYKSMLERHRKRRLCNEVFSYTFSSGVSKDFGGGGCSKKVFIDFLH